MIGLRVALIALGVLLGLVLLFQGAVLIGGLILTMAVVRAVLVFRWHKRSAQVNARREGFRARVKERRGF